jgi:hypothetical protein
VILVNPDKLVDYIIMQAKTMVKHDTSYDVLVRSLVFYPLGVTIDFWEENTYYCQASK